MTRSIKDAREVAGWIAWCAIAAIFALTLAAMFGAPVLEWLN